MRWKNLMNLRRMIWVFETEDEGCPAFRIRTSNPWLTYLKESPKQAPEERGTDLEFEILVAGSIGQNALR